MSARLRSVAAVLALGAVLTAFYFAHEQLPIALRAPTSLLLAPVAVVDGACYALGVPGIYGKIVPVFLVNVLASSVALRVAFLLRNRLRRGRPSRRDGQSA